ncbi:transposase, mutator type [Artemisia annua]|nr:transposase, mutator type [Artemisia annua]
MIKPIRGPVHWPKCNVPTTLLPPTHHPQIGRPRKERRKSRAEKDLVHVTKNGKLTRKLRTVTCDKCGTRGHNSRTCTGPRKAKAKGVGNKRKERSAASDVPDADNSARRSTPTDKGKGVAVDDGKKKKGPPRKKVIVLG